MGIDHLLLTGTHSPNPNVDDELVDDILFAVLRRGCVGVSLEETLKHVVDHLSDSNLKVVRE